MNIFDFVKPATIADAVAAASEPGAAYLAAGTNLLDLMKGGVTRPSRLVDINHLPGLDRIEHLPDGGVRIGSLVRNADLAHDPDFARRFPAVAEALLSGASPSSATLRRSAAISSSGRAARISTTSRVPATNAIRVPAAMPVAARTGFMPCWDGARTASRRTHPISASRS